MKLFCIGDLHIKVDNISIIDILEKKICDILQERAAEFQAIIVLGDVLHTHEKLHTMPLNRAHRFFLALRVFGLPIFVIVGNHDYIQNDQFLSNNHWMNVLEKVSVVDKIKYFDFDEEYITLCPYVPPRRFLEALKTGERDWSKSVAIFCHQEFEGARMQNGHISVEGDEWDLKRPQVISGHIHTRQTLSTGVHYVGSAIPTADGRSFVTIFDSKKVGEQTIEQIQLSFPRQKRITTTIEELETNFSSVEVSDISRIVIVGKYEDFKDFRRGPIYSSLLESKIKVIFKQYSSSKANLAAEPVEKSFPEYLYNEVLKCANEEIYCAYEKVAHNRDISPKDVLLVSLI